MKQRSSESKPSIDELRAELERVRYWRRYRSALRSTISTLIVAAAAAVLIAAIWMPVLRIYGSSMAPTLAENDIVVSLKSSRVQQGDLVAFYLGNKILVRRCIACPGQWVDIDADGVVYVDEKPLEEPYLTEKALGSCDIELPCQVPELQYFCMGDHRAMSPDSRNESIGCVPSEQIIGRIVFRVWPLDSLGRVA